MEHMALALELMLQCSSAHPPPNIPWLPATPAWPHQLALRLMSADHHCASLAGLARYVADDGFFRMQKCSFYYGIYVNGAVPESVANYDWDSAPWAQQLSTIFFVVFLLSSLLPVSQPTPVFGPKGGTIC